MTERHIFTGKCEKCGHDKLARVIRRSWKGIGFLLTGEMDVQYAFECQKCHATQSTPVPGEWWA